MALIEWSTHADVLGGHEKLLGAIEVGNMHHGDDGAFL